MNIINIRKLIVSWAAAFVATIALHYFFKKMFMPEFYEEHFLRGVTISHPNFILIAYAALIFLMSFAYPYYYRGGFPVLEGMKFGLVIGLLWRGLFLLVEYGNGVIDSDMVIVDGGWHMLEEGVTGIIIGAVYGREMAFRNTGGDH